MRLFLVVGLILFGSTAYGDNLTWKLEKGDEFYMEEVMKQDQVIKIETHEQKVNTVQTTVTRVAVEDVQSDGSVDLQFEITDISLTSNGAVVNDEINEKMKGATFEITLDPEFEVTRFDGYDKFVKRVVGDDPQLEASFRAILSEVSCRQLITQTFSVVPNEETKKGGKWQQALSMSLGPFGGVDVVREYQHAGHEIPKGEKKELVKMDLDGAAEYRPPGEDASGLPFKIAGGELEFEDFEGSGYFDLDKGRLHSMTVNLKLSGTLSVAVEKQEQDVHLQQQQIYVLTVTDEDPLAEKNPAKTKPAAEKSPTAKKSPATKEK